MTWSGWRIVTGAKGPAHRNHRLAGRQHEDAQRGVASACHATEGGPCRRLEVGPVNLGEVMRSQSSTSRILLVMVGAALWCLPVIADEPTPTPVQGAAASTHQRPTRTPIVIDNETLRKYADQGRITSVERQPSSRAAQSGATGLAGGMGRNPDGDDAAKRLYWREMYQQQLDLVQTLERQVETLDREIPGLWRDFYARDDPMYRDGVIKPKLDEALARRNEMEEQLNEERERLPKIREDARRDGAQPGWFRGLDQPKPKHEDAESPPAARLPSDFDVEVVTPDGT